MTRQTSRPGSTGTPRNCILATADSVRADHCGFLNDTADTTPTLDRLADDGLVFENAIAPGPRSPSSVPVFWTGEHIGTDLKGVYANQDEKRSRWQARRERIDRHLSRFPTLAERFKRRGYDTGAVVLNPWVAADTGFDRGFDVFEEIGGDSNAVSTPRYVDILNEFVELPTETDWFVKWTDYYDTILRVADDLTEPYFLWVFLLDPHRPYLAPRRYRIENSAVEMLYANYWFQRKYDVFDRLPPHLDTRFKRAYRDSIRSVDGFVSRLRHDLGDDDPVLAFHSDHGEALFEHGSWGHRPQVYEENVHVPLLLHNAGITGTVSQQAELRLLPELLLSIADGDPDPESVTCSPAVSRSEEDERVAVRTNAWKRLESRSDVRSARRGSDELYRLSADPTESENLFTRRPDVVSILNEWFETHAQRLTERERIAEATIEFVDDGFE